MHVDITKEQYVGILLVVRDHWLLLREIADVLDMDKFGDELHDRMVQSHRAVAFLKDDVLAYSEYGHEHEEVRDLQQEIAVLMVDVIGRMPVLH